MTAIADRRANGIRTRNRPQVPGAPFISDLERAAAGGVATLDETTVLVPANQLATGAAAAAKALMGDRTWGDVATQVEIDAETASRIAGDAASVATAAADATAKVAAHVALPDPHTQYALEAALGALATKTTIGTADIDADAVTYAKIQNVSATDKVLGRKTAGAGDVEEIACSATPAAATVPKTGAGAELALGFIPATLTGRTLVQSGLFTATALPNVTATTVLTLPAIQGAYYDVMVSLDAGGSGNYAEGRIICGTGGTTFSFTRSVVGGAITAITVDNSGNVKVTQNSGGSLNASGAYLRIA